MKAFLKAKNQRKVKYVSKMSIKKVLHCRIADNSKSLRSGGACSEIAFTLHCPF